MRRSESHADPALSFSREGKALDFEYSEDSFAGLFQRRDPREAGPLLDIERALNKLEKVRPLFTLRFLFGCLSQILPRLQSSTGENVDAR